MPALLWYGNNQIVQFESGKSRRYVIEALRHQALCVPAHVETSVCVCTVAWVSCVCVCAIWKWEFNWAYVEGSSSARADASKLKCVMRAQSVCECTWMCLWYSAELFPTM